MGELPIEELKKIADTVIEGIGRLDVSPCFALSGGEPFLRDDLFDLIDYLHQKGGSTVIMETTGTLLTPDVTALLVEHSPPVTAIQVSLDGG
jgi:MoaA/NifB/PqqE/SkfB family radical SAM enzyme